MLKEASAMRGFRMLVTPPERHAEVAARWRRRWGHLEGATLPLMNPLPG